MRELRVVSTGTAGPGGTPTARPVGTPWVFWVALLAAAHPLLAGAATAHLLLTTTDERFLPFGPGTGPVTATDRWSQVLTTTAPGWAALLSALTALLLAGALTSSRPGWLRTGAAGARCLAAVGAAAALAGAGGLGLRLWDALRDPTALELPTAGRSSSAAVQDWAIDASSGVAAVLVGGLVTVLAVRATRPGGPARRRGRTVGG